MPNKILYEEQKLSKPEIGKALFHSVSIYYQSGFPFSRQFCLHNIIKATTDVL
jgi:hypothetical protein